MKTIQIPKSFLLKENHRKPAILTLSKLIKTRQTNIALDFSNLEEIRTGDLMVLFAQIEKSTTEFENKIYIGGKRPTKKRVQKLLKSANEILHVNEEITDLNLNISEKSKLINPDLIDSYVNNLKKIGIKEYYYPFNTFLTELIGNAVEHGIENRKINWWLTHDINRKEKQIKYTFVDMGLGIVGSHKKAGLPIKYLFKRYSSIVLDSFYGKLQSSTKQKNRGKGLPQLRNMIENNYISNFVLITNKVSLRFENGVFISNKNCNFIGTYFSWTIDKNNYLAWKNIK